MQGGENKVQYYSFKKWGTYHDIHGRIRGGGGDDDLLGAALGVRQRLLSSGEHTGALHHIFRARARPVDVDGVALVEDGDLVAVDVEELAVLRDLTLELAVGGVVLEHVDHVVQRDEGVVDGHHLHQGERGTNTVRL